MILLASYKHITDFTQLARNTGFILSTVMIRVGIGTPGYTGAALFILSALLAAGVLRLSIAAGAHQAATEEENAEPQRAETVVVPAADTA